MVSAAPAPEGRSFRALVVAGPIGEIAQRLEELRVAEALGRAPPVAEAPPDPGKGAPPPDGARCRRVKVRVLGDAQLAAVLARGGPGVVEATELAGVVHVGFVGSDAQVAEIVRHLVQNGASVIGVEPERNELERIFLEVTRGDVQ